MKKRISIIFAVLLLLAMVFSMVACGSTGDSYGTELMPGEYDGSGFSNVTANKTEIGDSGATLQKKFIRTVKMYCETKDYKGSMAFISGEISAKGGYIQSSSLDNSSSGGTRTADLVIRIPANKLDEFLSSIETNEGVQISKMSSNSEEITSQYYDVVSRLKVLQTERDNLTEMMADFKDYNQISAMLEVEQRLYKVIAEIESLETQKKLYDDQVDLSTVSLQLREVRVYTEPEQDTFGSRIAHAFKDSWKGFAQGWQNFVVWFVSAFPTLLTLAFIFGGIGLAILLIIKKTTKKKPPQA